MATNECWNCGENAEIPWTDGDFLCDDCYGEIGEEDEGEWV